MSNATMVLIAVGLVVIPIIPALLLLPLAGYAFGFVISVMLREPRPHFRYYKWASIRKGPQGKASKICMACSGLILLIGATLFGLGLSGILNPAPTTTAATLLAIWYIPLIVGLVLGYLPQFDKETKEQEDSNVRHSEAVSKNT